MLRPDDRVLVGMSGGKDSTALLYLLWWLQHTQGISLHLTPVHVNGLVDPAPNLEPLESWVRSLGLNFSSVKAKDGGRSGPRDLSPCFRCSWRRKHTLFSTARKVGCNVVALGHHSDDVAVTGIMNLFYQGRFGSILPTQSYFKGEFKLIRPLYFVSEKSIVTLIRKERLPVIPSQCIHQHETSRTFSMRWLDTIMEDRPDAKRSLLGALHRQAAEICGTTSPDISASSRKRSGHSSSVRTRCGPVIPTFPVSCRMGEDGMR